MDLAVDANESAGALRKKKHSSEEIDAHVIIRSASPASTRYILSMTLLVAENQRELRVANRWYK